MMPGPYTSFCCISTIKKQLPNTFTWQCRMVKTWRTDSQAFHHSMVLGVFSNLNDPVTLFCDGLHTHISLDLSTEGVRRVHFCSTHSISSPCPIPYARAALCQTPCSERVQWNLPLPLMPKPHCLLMDGHSASLEWWGSDGILPSFITGILSLAYYCNVSPEQQPAGMELHQSLVCFINS